MCKGKMSLLIAIADMVNPFLYYFIVLSCLHLSSSGTISKGNIIITGASTQQPTSIPIPIPVPVPYYPNIMAMPPPPPPPPHHHHHVHSQGGMPNNFINPYHQPPSARQLHKSVQMIQAVGLTRAATQLMSPNIYPLKIVVLPIIANLDDNRWNNQEVFQSGQSNPIGDTLIRQLTVQQKPCGLGLRRSIIFEQTQLEQFFPCFTSSHTFERTNLSP